MKRSGAWSPVMLRCVQKQMISVLVLHLLCKGVSEGVCVRAFRARGLGIAVMPGPVENHYPALRSTLGHT